MKPSWRMQPFGRWGSRVAAVVLALPATQLLAGGSGGAVRTVERVDLTRYAGTWYEIASFPQWFQRGCTATTATYTLRPDGRLDVLNRCRKNSPEGKPKEARAVAWVTDRATNAKLKVRFFWPFSGQYWILDLGPDYDYAAVGDDSRKYLWILARTPTLDPAVYNAVVRRLRDQGFDTARLVRTRHAPGTETLPAAPGR